MDYIQGQEPASAVEDARLSVVSRDGLGLFDLVERFVHDYFDIG
jgi:hypothetical protein